MLDKYYFWDIIPIRLIKGESMFKELKMKIAARRVERQKARKNAKKSRTTTKSAKNKTSLWGCIWNIICAPFRWAGRMARRVWQWIRTIDLIGLVNLTLLIAIITLFSMLIIDVMGCNKKPVVIVAKNAPTVSVPAIASNDDVIVRTVKPRVSKTTLPIKTDKRTNKYVAQPVSVVRAQKCAVAEKQTARVSDTMYGDVIIDSRGAATMLRNGNKIQGNLYLQNMRKYTLPCNVYINGNLFLRDVNMLQFCGDFTITGNIYVSPRSSFGPIPRTARLGGQVIL